MADKQLTPHENIVRNIGWLLAWAWLRRQSLPREMNPSTPTHQQLLEMPTPPEPSSEVSPPDRASPRQGDQ